MQFNTFCLARNQPTFNCKVHTAREEEEHQHFCAMALGLMSPNSNKEHDFHTGVL